MDIFSLVGAGSTVSMVGLCWAMYKKSGSNGKTNGYVKKEDCHASMDSINQRIGDLKDHIDSRIDDVKDLINKNGR